MLVGLKFLVCSLIVSSFALATSLKPLCGNLYLLELNLMVAYSKMLSYWCRFVGTVKFRSYCYCSLFESLLCSVLLHINCLYWWMILVPHSSSTWGTTTHGMQFRLVSLSSLVMATGFTVCSFYSTQVLMMWLLSTRTQIRWWRFQWYQYVRAMEFRVYCCNCILRLHNLLWFLNFWNHVIWTSFFLC